MAAPFELPPLYFSKGQSLTSTNSSNAPAAGIALPAEVLHQCLAEFADCGDLAKLACVQRGWSTVLYDSVASSASHKWELACALLQGSRGLQPNAARAFGLLQELVLAVDGVTVDPDTQAPVYANNTPAAQSNEYATKAMKRLGFLFLEGTIEKSGSKPETGLQWLQCAFAAGNDIDAAHEMALIYEYGRFGVETDPSVAAQWFETAATAGHVEAMAELGLCYELGCGVEADDEKALDWYMKAAEAGHVTAKFSVAEAFEEARGVPQSDTEACLWYYKAAVAGCDDSRRALKRLEDIARIVVPGVRALLDG